MHNEELIHIAELDALQAQQRILAREAAERRYDLASRVFTEIKTDEILKRVSDGLPSQPKIVESHAIVRLGGTDELQTLSTRSLLWHNDTALGKIRYRLAAAIVDNEILGVYLQGNANRVHPSYLDIYRSLTDPMSDAPRRAIASEADIPLIVGDKLSYIPGSLSSANKWLDATIQQVVRESKIV